MEFDVDEIEVGCVIDKATIEAALGYTQESNWREYQFSLMKLQHELAMQLSQEGKLFTVVVDGGSLRVLTHEEASKYNDAASKNAIQKMERCLRRSQAVDTGDFSDDALKFHERSLLRQSRILQAIKSVRRKKLTLDTHENNKPKIVLKPKVKE